MKRDAKQMHRTKKGGLHVAVVVGPEASPNLDGLLLSRRAPWDDWASFVGEEQSEVVSRALEAARKWCQCQVWVGTLTGKAVFPTNFRVVAL